MATVPPSVIALRNVCMAFPKASGDPLQVLSGVDLEVRQGEILGLLGRSGSGKSTLLRIAAGLIRPTSGQVAYRGAALTGPAQGIALVFQTFALYPWLTVLQNVELGLDALGLSALEVRRRSQAAIDLIGLDGFQSAYPRELSGGMRQRVGFARALVSDPALLLMDEPFSALDVLTAETLRTDFIDLWIERKLPTNAVLLVTHNIEEAVLMCDRILVLGANPGHIAAELNVPLPQPRDRLSSEFRAIVDQIYSLLTARLASSVDLQHRIHNGLAQRLPGVSTNRIGGFLETLASAAFDGGADLARLRSAMSLAGDQLLTISAALHILGFAEVGDGRIRLTAAGRVFAQSGTEERKRLFREHLQRFVPLAAHIHQILGERDDHRAPRERFELELQDHLTPADAQQTLQTVIAWGRYAELFRYNDRSRMFSGTPAPS